MNMNSMKDSLCAYGVNFPEVMERFVDDEVLYYDCIRSFIDDPAFEDLRDSLQTSDYESAFDHTHTLKGVAANLGLTPLLIAVINILEPLRNQDFSSLEQLYGTVHAEREKLRQALDV